jgi:hypothetical protein
VVTASARVLPLGALAAMVGTLGPDPARLLSQASNALLAGAGRAGVIVAVDDVHLLDELSAVLVQQLVLHRKASVVLTLRTGEAAPDAVTGLWKDGHLARLELQPLSEDETATLVELGSVGRWTPPPPACCGAVPGVMRCICGNWSMGSWNPAGGIRLLGYGGGRGSRSCRRGWSSWCRPGSGSCPRRSATCWRYWPSASRWAYRCWRG